MAAVAMVTDSTSSLSPSACREADIHLIPLRVVIDGVSRPEVTIEEDVDAGAEPPPPASLRVRSRGRCGKGGG